MCGTKKKKKGTNELIYKTETELKMQKTNTVTWGKVERDKWEIGIDIYILLVVQLPSCVWLFATQWTAAHQASLSLTISWSLLKFMSIASVMPSSHLILWRPLLLLSSILPSIRDFSKESAVHIRWPKYWSFSKSPSNEYSGLISFSIDGFDLLAVQRTLKTLLQHHSWRHQFFSALPSLQASSHNCMWPQGRPQSWLYGLLSAEKCLCF